MKRLYRELQFHRRAESYLFARFDLNRFAGCWIAAHSNRPKSSSQMTIFQQPAKGEPSSFARTELRVLLVRAIDHAPSKNFLIVVATSSGNSSCTANFA